MPNRLIREGWLESEHIDQLDAHAERFFLRLCLRADDFGRYSANPQLLKSSLFPLKDEVRSADISRWTSACEDSGLLRCYELVGKRFLEIVKFDQRTRAKSSKFPAPDGTMPERSPPIDGHMSVTCQSHDGHPRTETETETETDPPNPPAGGDAFDRFWSAYPKKRAKGAAEKAWERTRKERPDIERILLVIAAESASDEWTKEGGRFIPHPASWLTGKGWENEATTTRRKRYTPPKAHVAGPPMTDEQRASALALVRKAKEVLPR